MCPLETSWGIALASVCTAAAYVTVDALSAGACALVAALFVYARQLLMPRINRARDRELAGDDTAGATFRQLHLQSVVINGLQLLLLIVATLYSFWV